jgi:hypothetical protein
LPIYLGIGGGRQAINYLFGLTTKTKTRNIQIAKTTTKIKPIFLDIPKV